MIREIYLMVFMKKKRGCYYRAHIDMQRTKHPNKYTQQRLRLIPAHRD